MKKACQVGKFWVVELNAREQQEYGYRYAVIDPELYTGCMEIDHGSFEYDDINDLREAMEKAKSLCD
ncbi:MAG TPA: hypothetical protein VN426_06300 [Syntrophomonadaceae bacterium]|nr:hypothetical protein [Syntrophomonadaceae bacterium]